MENQKLPNASAVLILGILSILLCWCYGIIGIILGIVALILASKDMKLYREAPQNFINYSNLNAGRIMAIVGLVLSVITLVYMIWIISLIGLDSLSDPSLLQERIKELQGR